MMIGRKLCLIFTSKFAYRKDNLIFDRRINVIFKHDPIFFIPDIDFDLI